MDKYSAAPNQIRLGSASDAAHGIPVLLGISDAQLGTFLQEPEAAILREFEMHGRSDDKENVRCVLEGTKRSHWESGISVPELQSRMFLLIFLVCL